MIRSTIESFDQMNQIRDYDILLTISFFELEYSQDVSDTNYVLVQVRTFRTTEQISHTFDEYQTEGSNTISVSIRDIDAELADPFPSHG